jgi:hypothetical protein
LCDQPGRVAEIAAEPLSSAVTVDILLGQINGWNRRPLSASLNSRGVSHSTTTTSQPVHKSGFHSSQKQAGQATDRMMMELF